MEGCGSTLSLTREEWSAHVEYDYSDRVVFLVVAVVANETEPATRVDLFVIGPDGPGWFIREFEGEFVSVAHMKGARR